MGVMEVLFPKTCVGCGKWGGYLCGECVDRLEVKKKFGCPMCGKGSMLGMTHGRCRRKLGMDGLVSVLKYRGLGKRMIGKLKYKLVRDLFDEVLEIVVSLGDFEALERRNWVVVAVPLHPRRERWRGFNQAEELAKKLANYFDWEWKRELLKRKKYTKLQVELKGDERRENVRGVFRISNKLQGASNKIKGKDILLVDDVWTTGATMRECAKILKRKGVKKVWGLVVAS